MDVPTDLDLHCDKSLHYGVCVLSENFVAQKIFTVELPFAEIILIKNIVSINFR